MKKKLSRNGNMGGESPRKSVDEPLTTSPQRERACRKGIPAIASLLYFQSPCHRATLYRVVCVPRVRVRETTLLNSLKSRTHTHVYILYAL